MYAWQLFGGGGGGAGEVGPLDAAVLVPGQSPWWTYLSYAFLHDRGGVLHIIFNMLILWVFGPIVEDRLRRTGFIAFYLGGAVIAGVTHGLSGGGPVIGASGAVTAVTGAALAMFPRARVRTLVIFFIIGIYMIPAWFFIGLAIARDVIPLVLGHASRVAFEAHLGGYAFGFGLSMTLLGTRVLSREPYDMFSLMRQGQRRRELRAAVRGADAERRQRLAPERPEDPRSADIASRRAEVSTAIAEGRLDDAGRLYAALIEAHGDHEGAATLSKRAQLTLAGHLYRSGGLELAAEAFRRYLVAFPDDAERGEIALLLARIERGLGRDEEAAALLDDAVEHLTDAAHLEAARRELNELRSAATEDG